MGKENCPESVLFQLSKEKSPTTGTNANTSIGNSSFIFVVVEDNENQQNIQENNDEESNNVNRCNNFLVPFENANSTQLQQIFDEHTVDEKDDEYSRTRRTFQLRLEDGNTSYTTTTSNQDVRENYETRPLLIDEMPSNVSDSPATQISQEQCNILAENLNIDWKDECAHDCSGDLIGGCTLIEEWHLPFVGAEVVCIPDSMSGEYGKNNGECDLTANINNSEFQTSSENDFDSANLFVESHEFDVETTSQMVSYTTKTIAEVTCAKNEVIQIHYTNQDSLSSNYYPTLLRRCSYEEMVHVEKEVEEDALNEMVNFNKSNSSSKINLNDGNTISDDYQNVIKLMQKSLIQLTQWALTLQEVYEDRDTSGLLQSEPERFNCSCKRASTINQHLSQLKIKYINAIEDQDSFEDDEVTINELRKSLDSVNEMQLDVQSILRTHVSIQVSVPPGKAKRSKAAYVVGEVVNLKAYIHDVIRSVQSLVNDLLNTETCEVCPKKEDYTVTENIQEEKDFNYNLHDNNKVLSEMTIKTEENKRFVNSDDVPNKRKNKRKRKQIFFQLQQEDENFSKDDHSTKPSTSSVEESQELKHRNRDNEIPCCDREQTFNLDSSHPSSSAQPSASKRAKTLKNRRSQTQPSYSSPPRPRRHLMLSPESKNKNKSDNPIIRSGKLNYTTSNSMLKPMYLRPIYIPPDEPNVMYQFLECKRKVQRVDGLYDWVLWKETLRESIELLNQNSRYEMLSSLNKPKPRL